MLAARAAGSTVFLCGSVENEAEVRDLFDVIICLVVDLGTLTDRLRNRTTNAFGAHPEELAAAVRDNALSDAIYRPLGATFVDATMPLGQVTGAVLSAAP
ncbi:hypothetical protein [Cryptosporangium phraense]|uniref:Uncharacterized protein n=1 Tax=Cryptosporangium phraense TaxID=2593070 RepID=A0A545ANT9_9ACTN|nr:hypothetical protein [Cryptosporangium phraense]TQS42998.1 hypothetical protein FL583_21405 [Cryptosporangium phraense]